MDIIRHFVATVESRPDAVAVVWQGTSYSYRQFAATVQGAADRLSSLGLAEGDAVVVALDNGPGLAAIYLAAAELGLMVAAIGAGTPQRDVFAAIEVTRASAFVGVDAGGDSFAPDHYRRLTGRELRAWRFRDADLAATPGQAVALGKGPSRLSLNYILTMTSGSTGDPKPIVLTQEVKVKRSLLGARDLYGLSNGEVVLVASPMYHSLALRLTLLPLITGGTAVILPRFNARAWLEAVQKHRVTFTIAVSSHLEQLAPMAAGYDLSSLKCIVSSSSLLRDELKAKCLQLLKCDFHECYGTSEVGIATNLTAEDARRKLSSVGKALPYVDLAILGEDGERVRPGNIGEIAIRSETMFGGYFNRPEMTARSVRAGYFLSGDLGWVDAEGFLHLSGRKKDVIIVGGSNVFPVDVERVIRDVSGVRDVAVIGVADPRFGEAILAVIEAGPECVVRDVRRACLENLSDFQQPAAFEFVENLPRNAMGKILKPALRERFAGYDATASLRKLLEKGSGSIAG